MARKVASRGKTQASRGLDWTIGLAILATVMAAAALPLCIVLAAGLVPTGVAIMVDRLPGRFLVRAVGPANLAGMVLPVLMLFRSDFTLQAALHVLADPRNWLIMYGSAAIGWILHWAMPLVAEAVLDFNAKRTEVRLRRRTEQIIAEWGAEVGGGRPAQPPK